VSNIKGKVQQSITNQRIEHLLDAYEPAPPEEKE
jgi:hypothetical protein